jgi:hypothetical protein
LPPLARRQLRLNSIRYVLRHLASVTTFLLTKEVKVIKVFGLISIALVLSSCGPSMSQLKKRASFDMGCPAEQLTTTPLGGSSTGVTGCGKQITYVYISGSGWLQNSDTAAIVAAKEEAKRQEQADHDRRRRESEQRHRRGAP